MQSDYETSAEFSGEAEAALSFLIQTFTQLGFRIEQKDARRLEFSGPGMNSTQQNPLMAVSRLRVESAGRSLKTQAEFGGARRMAKFMFLLIVGLAAGLGGLFAVLFDPAAAGIVALALSPWLVLIPLIYWMIRRRAARALDNVLHNLASTLE